MNGHGKEICACGSVIQQCRCMQGHGTPRIVCQTCAKCQPSPALAPDPGFGRYSLPIVEQILDEGGRLRWLERLPLTGRIALLAQVKASKQVVRKVEDAWATWMENNGL